MNKPQTVDAQFKLRLPTTLKLKIENEAQGLKRSMNAEIVARLEKSFNFKKLDNNSSVHDKFHRALVLSGLFFLKIASTFLNSSFFPKPIKRRIAI